MNFKRINNITGWVVFLIALVTYMLTKEARGSLWDCGEFVACAYKVQLPHPPGAPVFVLLGRLFIILFGNSPMAAAGAINIMSALASAATILFLFWTITHFARKMFVEKGKQLPTAELIGIMAAGVVGGLAYTFSDSFWYSAVEGEVYALSSFFTAIVFWAILKWEHADEMAGTDAQARSYSDRWIVFLFFMVGLSIGVHLLSLLTIPAIVMTYYYRRFVPTTRGAIYAFIIGCALTGIVQVIAIQYSMKAAGLFDVFFVNNFGMPFFSGFAIYFIAVAVAIYFGFKLNAKTPKRKTVIFFIALLALLAAPFFMSSASTGVNIFKFLLVAAAGYLVGHFFKPSGIRILKLVLWCYVFVMLGYMVYLTSMIRSNANPSVDMNNVDNPISLVYYLAREQYGSAPIVYGPHFAAQAKIDANGYTEIVEGEMKYVKGNGKYIPTGREKRIDYEESDKQFFPRIWDSSNDQQHANFYGGWLGIGQDQSGRFEAPTYAQNFNWFFTYQMGHMFWRYFMWNFSGRQNDLQGLGSARDGNWISGITAMDNSRLGNQSNIPESIKTGKANNKLYMLPFLLGVLGFVFQYFRNRKDWIVTLILFFFTGTAIIIYTNVPGNQPRERDYVFVGAFYVFTIWVGLAVVALIKLANETKNLLNLKNILVFGTATTFLLTLFSSLRGNAGSGFTAGLIAAGMFALLVILLTFLFRAISSQGRNTMLLSSATSLILLAVPVLMCQQEWDDHDRKKKTIAPDLARDYLESCAPNAILFSFGDNDTYPLWYAQEVEGIRPDIRIINTSLLGIDWYINQLRYSVNESKPIDVIWTPEQIEGENRNYMRYVKDERADNNTFYPLYDIMKNVLGKPDIHPETGRDIGVKNFPVSKVSIEVDTALARKNGTALPNDIIVSPMPFEIPQNKLHEALLKNDLMVLNIIAANKFERPIYFTAPYGELGFGGYLRKDGLSYRLVPVVQNDYPMRHWEVDKALRENRTSTQIYFSNGEAMYKNLMDTKAGFGGAEKKGVYFDETNRQQLNSMRAIYAEAAGSLADKGDKEKAVKLLDKVLKGINTESLPYAMVSRFSGHNQTGLILLEACYKTGKLDEAKKIKGELKKDIEQQTKYYKYLETNRPDLYTDQMSNIETQMNGVMQIALERVVTKYEGAPAANADAKEPMPGNAKESLKK